MESLRAGWVVAPGSLGDDSWAGSGHLTLRRRQLRSASSARPGPWQEEPDWVLDECPQAG